MVLNWTQTTSISKAGSELSAVTHEPYVALYSMYRCVAYLPTVA